LDNYGSADLDATPIEYLEAQVLSNYGQLTDELQPSGNVDDLTFVLGGLYYDSKPTGNGGVQSPHSFLFGDFVDQTEMDYIEDISKV
jgi:hypothetical protein